MESNIDDLICSFEGRKVLVVGEAMLDSYLEGDSERLCGEAPVPVVAVKNRFNLPGGAANTAVNVRTLQAEPVFLSVIGSDIEGDLLRKALEKVEVGTDGLLIDPGRTTLAKQRVIAGSQIVVRFDQGSTEDLSETVERALINSFNQHYETCDAIIISDYGYGILTPAFLRNLARLQKQSPRLLVVDSKRLPMYRSLKATAVKPNYKEALQLLDLPKPRSDSERVAQMTKYGRKILDLSGAQIAAITLDREGALIFQRDERVPYRTYARPRPNSRAAGAGDTFVSALALSLLSGASLESTAELASAASEVVVGKDGTATCTPDELRAYFSTNEKFFTDVFQLVARIATYRREKQRIVFTNGCFDILHRGHVTYLNRAKALGDILIVGLNTDESVRRLKGPARPINPLEDRAQILAALSCVDYIVPFEGNTPHELIQSIKPDVFVKGGDYSRATLPEAKLVEDLGGIVEILPYLDEHSTTNIIERIQKLSIPSVASMKGNGEAMV
jgi:D-beta-D-heptose 7-phosphate kinase/D-beta-D-heptose 1-phosphate adenosyltransferase